MDEVERRARLICGALTAVDPDTEMLKGVRLWQLYARAAQMLIDDEERRAERNLTQPETAPYGVSAITDREPGPVK